MRRGCTAATSRWTTARHTAPPRSSSSSTCRRPARCPSCRPRSCARRSSACSTTACRPRRRTRGASSPRSRPRSRSRSWGCRLARAPTAPTRSPRYGRRWRRTTTPTPGCCTRSCPRSSAASRTVPKRCGPPSPPPSTTSTTPPGRSRRSIDSGCSR